MHTGKVSGNFFWVEVEESQEAARNGIDNSVPALLEDTIKRTALRMERVRCILEYPIHVNSWYRCPNLQSLPQFYNPNSQHPRGEAVDFICPEFGLPVDICKKIIEYTSLICFDQLILEHTWVHVSFCTSDPTHKPRNQVLSLLNNKKYAGGLTDKDGNPL